MKRQPFRFSPQDISSVADAPEPYVRALRPTTLRGKTMLIVGATVVGLLLVLAIPARFVVLGGFLKLEDQSVRRNVQRATNALTGELTSLSKTTASYGMWDATYTYVTDRNPDYIADNLADTAFQAASLNTIVIFNAADALVSGKAYDLKLNHEVPVPRAFEQATSALAPLLASAKSARRATGIIVLPEGPMLLAAEPVLPNSGAGPSNGTIVLGRFIDEAIVRRLSETTQLAIHITPVNAANLSADDQAARAALLHGDTIVVQPFDEHTVAGVTLVRDIAGQPALLVRAEIPRAIYAQGMASTRYFMLSLLGACLVFSLVILLLLQHTVLRPLTRLSAETTRVGTHGDVSERVTLAGQDELAQLARSINGMLAALEHTQDERRKAEEDRAQLQETFIRSREQIIHMTIHDLKTPLSVIMGYLDMLRMTTLPDEQLEYVTYARRGGTQMLHIIQDVLDTERMKEGQLVLHRAPFEAQDLFETCLSDLEHWAKQNHQRISLSVADALPMLFLDIQLMRRVMINLLSNAIKHTPPGTSIVLGAEIKDPSVVLWVWDDGSGIPSEQQEMIFEPFKTGNPDWSQPANTGLGLTFCKLAVEAHGGTIAVESAADHYTMFTISLPLATATQPRNATLSTSETQSLFVHA